MQPDVLRRDAVARRLAADIGATDTSLTLEAGGSSLPSTGTFEIKIGGETITVGARSGNTLSSLTRGAGSGTDAAPHNKGDAVTYVVSGATAATPSGGSLPAVASTFVQAHGGGLFDGPTDVRDVSMGFDEGDEYYTGLYIPLSYVSVPYNHSVHFIRVGPVFIGDFPPVPDWLQTLATGWGADPADVWNIFIVLDIAAITGADAGKTATLINDPSVAHPVGEFGTTSDYYTKLQVSAGDLAVTVDSGDPKIWLPSDGIYALRLLTYADFFYPS